MADLRIALASALGPLYRVEREVRPVGDYRLFVARESPTGPDLLVKVLPRSLSLVVDAERLEREVLLLADRLQHARLVAPRGAGRAGPFVYHTRPFVEGTTLRAWLMNHGELPVARAVEILRDVLVALAHAHAQQVAHGDLRPENVLVTEGKGGTLVADTGIVSAVGRSLTVGTPGAASAQGDMLAVADVVHEMLTGEAPRPEPEPLERSRALPAWLPELLHRCRAAKPAARWADAGEALAAIHTF